MSIVPRQRVLFVLAAVAIMCCAGGGFVDAAPNRLVSGMPLALWHSAGALALWLALGGVALVALSFTRSTRASHLAALGLAVALLLVLLLAAGGSAARLMAAATPATRVSLGWAFWTAAFCLAMIAIDALQRLGASNPARLAVVVAIVAAIAGMAAAGRFDALSLAREYAARRSEFGAELARHCVLVAASVAIALAIGAPLGIFVARRPLTAPSIFGTLNLLQTIPSVALFGLLIAPLSALGIGGIGAAPAIIALVLYALLPIVRNTEAGIAGVDPAAIDAARGMGLTGGQILWRIELPLGMPVFIAGLRIVTVQAIGLTVVAALIGAGGLGSFVFQGIGQYAIDLVLLGAIPTILLALAADFVLALLAAFFERKAES
ncbi:MAG TPA: ABC transporter permease [Stellaceae bacterium]|jgi:osmoprotectant transport system permease protein